MVWYRLTSGLLLLVALSCTQSTEFSSPVDPSVPLAPLTNLSLLSMTESTLSLSWKDNIVYTNPEQKKGVDIVVEESFDGTSFSEAGVLSATASTGVLTAHFVTNKKYFFRVSARVGSKEGSSSNTVSGSVPFAAPTDLGITSMTTTSVGLTWKDNSDFESGFRVEMSTDGTLYTQVATLGANTTEAVLPGSYDPTIVYYFRVCAITVMNASPYSHVVSESVQGRGVLGMGFVFVEAGAFRMGPIEMWMQGTSASTYDTIRVQITRGFSIGTYEVTQSDWARVVAWKMRHGGTTLDPYPSQFSGEDRPVERVSWQSVDTWLGYLNEMEGTTKYRLPTEAEWEFAARGGNASQGYPYSGGANPSEVGWLSTAFTTLTSTFPVGQKKPNELGIFDMTGNVWEWCRDPASEYILVSPGLQVLVDPTGWSGYTGRVVRGSGFGSIMADVNLRMTGSPTTASQYFGFRVVREQ